MLVVALIKKMEVYINVTYIEPQTSGHMCLKGDGSQPILMTRDQKLERPVIRILLLYYSLWPLRIWEDKRIDLY